jgi:Acetyltransferases
MLFIQILNHEKRDFMNNCPMKLNTKGIQLDNYLIRELRDSEAYILEDMLYEAIFQPDESNPIPREIINQPNLIAYINNWGRLHDLCIVAEVNGKIAGAVWTRIFDGEIRGYGTIDKQTPELSISLFKENRNKGIGSTLMKIMLEKLKEHGYSKISLSVSKNNYAFKLYQNLGFIIIEERKDDYLMIYELS